MHFLVFLYLVFLLRLIIHSPFVTLLLQQALHEMTIHYILCHLNGGKPLFIYTKLSSLNEAGFSQSGTKKITEEKRDFKDSQWK